jgi:hypothetical protein
MSLKTFSWTIPDKNFTDLYILLFNSQLTASSAFAFTFRELSDHNGSAHNSNPLRRLCKTVPATAYQIFTLYPRIIKTHLHQLYWRAFPGCRPPEAKFKTRSFNIRFKLLGNAASRLFILTTADHFPIYTSYNNGFFHTLAPNIFRRESHNRIILLGRFFSPRRTT